MGSVVESVSQAVQTVTAPVVAPVQAAVQTITQGGGIENIGANLGKTAQATISSSIDVSTGGVARADWVQRLGGDKTANDLTFGLAGDYASLGQLGNEGYAGKQYSPDALAGAGRLGIKAIGIGAVAPAFGVTEASVTGDNYAKALLVQKAAQSGDIVGALGATGINPGDYLDIPDFTPPDWLGQLPGLIAPRDPSGQRNPYLNPPAFAPTGVNSVEYIPQGSNSAIPVVAIVAVIGIAFIISRRS